MTEKFPLPFVRVALAGSMACASVLVKCTVPEYVATTWFEASSAITVTFTAAPMVAFGETVTEK